LLILFIIIEIASGEYAQLHPRFLKQRTLAVVCGYTFTVAGAFFTLLYYLPIYFQAVRNSSAARSGIDNLPLILGASIFSVVAGALLTVWAHFVPVMVVGSVIASIGTALLYTLGETSSSAKWIGYQAVAGIGIGLIFQIPIITAQAIVDPADLNSITATVLLFQMIGGAVFVSAAQAGFTNRLLHELAVTAPSLDSVKVITTGATKLRVVFEKDQLSLILRAYMTGLKVPFLICTVLACISFILALAPRWESLRGKVKMGFGGT
jgi:MFS transporter, DHA2 family, glioxin efflux transporter